MQLPAHWGNTYCMCRDRIYPLWINTIQFTKKHFSFWFSPSCGRVLFHLYVCSEGWKWWRKAIEEIGRRKSSPCIFCPSLKFVPKEGKFRSVKDRAPFGQSTTSGLASKAMPCVSRGKDLCSAKSCPSFMKIRKPQTFSSSSGKPGKLGNF